MCVAIGLNCFFFFKQKTAYEMRISDWSSDVCSSDLPDGPDLPGGLLGTAFTVLHCTGRIGRMVQRDDFIRARAAPRRQPPALFKDQQQVFDDPVLQRVGKLYRIAIGYVALRVRDGNVAIGSHRSEEHTSELQSLMRISYAVFCLKKKKRKTQRR